MAGWQQKNPIWTLDPSLRNAKWTLDWHSPSECCFVAVAVAALLPCCLLLSPVRLWFAVVFIVRTNTLPSPPLAPVIATVWRLLM